MFRWAPYAMVRITMCLVAGILGAIHTELALAAQTRIACACAAIVFFLAIAFKSKLVSGCAGLLTILLAGYLLTIERTQRTRSNHVIHVNDTVQGYRAIISSYPEERSRSIRTLAEIISIKTNTGWHEHVGSLLLYFPLRDSMTFKYGDVLLVSGAPRSIPEPANKWAFDFRKFMAYKGVYLQDVMSPARTRIVGNSPPSRFLERAIHLRLWAAHMIKSVVIGEREQATATALVLGVTDGLDNELLHAYSATGALHVLAVSGLHISIIYWILLLLLKPLDRNRTMKWVIAIVSVFVLWSYAFVCGWSPSVLRAVVMFSFVAVSRPWRQSTNIFNTLASSMFCLLLFDPYYIMSVGFQLSYLAVFGIVYLQPRLYKVWEPQNRIVDEIWKVSSVSVAAQIATLPIGLYYFHQFPNYFLPANLAVIPISFVVLILGLAIAALGFIQPVAHLLGILLTWTIKTMNGIVIAVEKMPFSVIDGIFVTQAECLLLAGVIGSVVILFSHKQFFWLPIALAMAVGLSSSQWQRHFSSKGQTVLRVYNIAGISAVDHIALGRSTLMADSIQLTENILSYNIRLAWLNDNVQDHSFATLKAQPGDGTRIWWWDETSILQIIDRQHRLPRAEFGLVIISNNSITSLAELSGVKCEKIIVDSSNSRYFAERLREEANTMGLTLWSVPHQGAFEHRHDKR